MNQRKQRESVKSDEQKDVRTRFINMRLVDEKFGVERGGLRTRGLGGRGKKGLQLVTCY